jgi:probable HAF family extracellular repeat protein
MSLPGRARTLLIVLLWPLAASIPTAAIASPTYALIDMGYNNRLGEPDYETLSLSQSGATIAVTHNPDGTATRGTYAPQNATAVNDQGDAVGSSSPSPDAFLFKGGTISNIGGYQGGQAIDLGTLGGGWSRAAALNDADQVVGFSYTAANQQHAFLYSGQMTDLGTLGGNTSAATAISSNGLVVGTSTTAAGATHGFLYSNGKMTDLGTLGPSTDQVAPTAVNASGQVVGTETGPDGTHGFLYSNGKMVDLFGPNSQAIGINNSGQVIGWSRTQGALLYSGGQVLKLDSLIQGRYASWYDYGSGGSNRPPGYNTNWIPDMPKFINDQGQIVAFAYSYPDQFGSHGSDVFLQPINTPGDPTPVPEPSTLALVATAAAAGLGWRRVRKRPA